MAYRRPPIVLTIANFNMHAGIDGWGRPFDYLDACRSLHADVLVLQETWTAAGLPPEEGQAGTIAATLGYTAVPCTLADGYRIPPPSDAPPTWMPRPAFLERNKSLYFDAVRPIAAATMRSARFKACERGTWGIAVLVRHGLTLDATRIVHLPTLGRDLVRRAAIVVDLTIDGVPLSVIGTHMSHLHYGSSRHYRLLRHRFETEARPNAVLSGDMNLWGPPVRYFMRGWHRAVRGPSWPTWRPHSQIDHILVHGALRIVSGEVRPDAGSDHRPVRAVLDVA
jgi:endonuclease/exonuclease/phosphatase family metal-dependent hydrolase